MPEHIALKRLTASDLTLFESLFRRLNAGNQKAINLNADVFIKEFYPDAPNLAPIVNNEIPVALRLYGPGGKPAHKIARKIIKNATYKNWRLNGEFIPGPEGDAARYDSLQPSDLALITFSGAPLPTNLEIVLLARSDSTDAGLYASLTSHLGGKSMVPLTNEDVAAAIATAGVSIQHPINELIVDPALDSALEDAAFGGERGTRAVLRRRTGRGVSAADLARARQNADRTGAEGEGLINGLLTQQVASGKIASMEWASATNAISPFDFTIEQADGLKIKLDVKSTIGPFDNDFHISVSELIEAAQAPERYDIYRVYSLDEDGGELRIAEDIRAFARNVLASLNLPAGVKCDGFSVAVDAEGLTWGAEVYVERPAGDEDHELL